MICVCVLVKIARVIEKPMYFPLLPWQLTLRQDRMDAGEGLQSDEDHASHPDRRRNLMNIWSRYIHMHLK